MATQLTIQAQRIGAEIYAGPTTCKKKSAELLEELHLPRGLLPLRQMEEVGYNRSTGFVWLRQKNTTEHFFKKVGRTVSYAPEVTALVEDRRMKGMTGVKTKELFIWLSVSDVFIDDKSINTISFKTPSGFGLSFPVSAFEQE